MRKIADFLTLLQTYQTNKKMKRIIVLFFVFALTLFDAKAIQIAEELTIISIHASIQNGAEFRTNSISADITGNLLTITFNENVGIAHIVIKDSNGVYIDRENVFSTPDYATFIINDAGYYRMDITLSNGEQYYGYFQVEN